MMRIGFDAKRAFLNQSGLGNYSRTLLESLRQFYPKNQYFLYSPKLPETATTKSFFEHNFHLRSSNGKMLSSLWRSRFIVSDLKKDNIELYHGLSHEIPIGLSKTGIKSVVTIHDLIFLRYPKLYPAVDRNIYRQKVIYACQNADVIVAISEQTKRDIVHFLNISEGKISVIYQSCSELFRQQYSPTAIQKVKEKYQLPHKYLLYVGTIEERKNLLLVAKALKRLPPYIKCVAVGQKSDYFKKIMAYLDREQLGQRMLFLENVGQAELPILYRNARVFVYPSRFEGFGIPVLEAITSGIPIIAAKGSCLEEAGGENSLYIHPDDDEGIAEAVLKIWNNPDFAREMITKGKEHAAAFHPKILAQQLMVLYRDLLK